MSNTENALVDVYTFKIKKNYKTQVARFDNPVNISLMYADNPVQLIPSCNMIKFSIGQKTVNGPLCQIIQFQVVPNQHQSVGQIVSTDPNNGPIIAFICNSIYAKTKLYPIDEDNYVMNINGELINAKLTDDSIIQEFKMQQIYLPCTLNFKANVDFQIILIDENNGETIIYSNSSTFKVSGIDILLDDSPNGSWLTYTCKIKKFSDFWGVSEEEIAVPDKICATISDAKVNIIKNTQGEPFSAQLCIYTKTNAE